MEMNNNFYSHKVPLSIKIFCSICIWFPVLISFISIWYFPNITIIYNIIVHLYIWISLFLMYVTSLLTFIKQKRIINEFFNTSEWSDLKNSFNQRHINNSVNNLNIRDILHIVIIPLFKEDSTILDNALKSLVEQNVSMIVGLALEEREIDSSVNYDHIINKYNKHLEIIKTIHPMDLANETQGKGPNCNYCVQKLVEYYEMYFKHRYDYAMITVCDSDTIWCHDYFLYLSYLSVQNNLNYFDHIVYSPNITNFKNFRINHILSNWMSIARLTVIHGHFRCLGYIRCFTSQYHIPLKLFKRIDYWDCEFVHEDVHLSNKLAILDDKNLTLKSTYLSCDNQTPTESNSMYTSLLLLWKQSFRWNLFVYDIYYLVHQLLLNISNKKRYQNFHPNTWKIIKQILNNYENLFYYFLAPISNNMFWIFYLCIFNNDTYEEFINYLLIYFQPCCILIQTLLIILHAWLIFNVNDENTKGEPYRWKKHCLFVLGLIFFPFFAIMFQGVNLFFAWVGTLKRSSSHPVSTVKIVVKPEHP